MRGAASEGSCSPHSSCGAPCFREPKCRIDNRSGVLVRDATLGVLVEDMDAAGVKGDLDGVAGAGSGAEETRAIGLVSPTVRYR